MIALAAALVLWSAGAVAALALGRRAAAARVGIAASVAGSVAAGIAAAGALVGHVATWRAAWPLPVGSLALRLDPLAGAFLLPVAVAGALGAPYGGAYLRAHEGRERGAPHAWWALLLAAMAVVCTASDLVLLLVAWEAMTLSSFFLVVTDDAAPGVRTAGLRYLIAAHVGTAALVLLVLVLGAGSGSYAMAAVGGVRTALPAGVLFALALVGFGTKAGLVPLHVWLPDAHPAAPSHVSALMSGVMVTMGFYGLARILPLLGEAPAWWGFGLMAIGAAGAFGGIAFAIAQRDVKRVLAYSTIENAGIVAIAFGAGIAAGALGMPTVAGLAWTAALLHLWNHALAKSLLFQGWGAVALAVHDRSVEGMGGLLRRWRTVGPLLVAGAAAIAAMPGLNAFTSEWLLLRALLGGGLALRGGAQGAMLAAVVVLALTGGLALLCFVRLTGIALLGHARTPAAARAAEPGWWLRAPMLAFALLCVVVAIVPGAVAALLGPAVRVAAPGADTASAPLALAPLGALLPAIVVVAAAAYVGRALLLRRRAVRSAPVWGCAFPVHTPAMQYTASSLAEPATRLLQPLLHTRVARSGDAGPWARRAAWRSTTPDRVLHDVYAPAAAMAARLAHRVRGTRRARVTGGVLAIVVAVLALLVLLLLQPGAHP